VPSKAVKIRDAGPSVAGFKSFPVPGFQEITNLFFIDIRAPGELCNIDVLKPERQRLIVKKLWA